MFTLKRQLQQKGDPRKNRCDPDDRNLKWKLIARKGSSMKKQHPESRLLIEPINPVPSNRPARVHVRYVGFEGIDGGRRLTFSVKPLGHDSVEITFEISDALFKDASGISIQDAAPMAYEKLMELLATEDAFDSNKLCLTQADIAQYTTRHLSSQKRTHSTSDGRRRSDVLRLD